MHKISFTGDGHRYSLAHFEGDGEEHLSFICKSPTSDGGFETIHDGTTNETVISVLIHRLQTLDAKMPSEFNKNAISHLRAALDELERRTSERVERGVEGTNNN